MKDKFIILTVVSFVLLVVFSFSRKKPATVTTQKNKNLYALVAAPLESQPQANKILPKIKNDGKPDSQTRIIPGWCQSQWQRIVSLGVEQIAKDFTNEKIDDFQACLGYLPQTAAAEAHIQQSCKVKDGRYVLQGTCMSSLLLYRSVLIDLSTLDDVAYSKMPLQMPLNKLLGRMLQGEEVYLKSRDQMQAMAQEIKNLEPNNPSTYKILSVVELMTNSERDILPLVQEGLRLDPYNLELRELWFHAQIQKKDFDIASYVKVNPKDDMAIYYYASNLWKEGQMDLSRKMAQQLAEHYPKNKKYQKTVEYLKIAKDSKERPFFSEISIIPESW